MDHQLKINPLDSWLPQSSSPHIIAGPCSAESEFQVLKTAAYVAQFPGVIAFRSGIWKPRTRPGEYEGPGDSGLKWLQKVKQETGLKVCVEVAQPEHIEACFTHDIDILWIGARTIVNPFSVKEISRTLEGCDIPVMLKNPMHPDLSLWIGALERLNMSGIQNLIAIHRGFSVYHKHPFRNLPNWEIPIELKRRFPELPIFIDPSHIAGNADLVPELAQMTLDMSFDGLMIEVHPEPKKALSDPGQQLDFASFSDLMNTLQVRTATDQGDWEREMELLRHRIDHLDTSLIDILSQRFEIVREIGSIKQKENLPLLQIERWNKILSERMLSAEKSGLNPGFVKRLLEEIHKEAIKIQSKRES